MELRCDCGLEPKLYVDMQSGPGCLCHLSCECGCVGAQRWDVIVPWDDLADDWNDPTERELRSAEVQGLVKRVDGDKWQITSSGAAWVQRKMKD